MKPEQALKKYDETSPVQYEQVWKDDYTDIVAPMYHRIPDLKEFLKNNKETRPLIMSEYSHAMGNSNGNFRDYWELIESHPQLQGGFIWDWMDQGIAQCSAKGEKFFAFGGDFGSEGTISYGAFCCNGLLFSDQTPKPALWEVSYAYQNFKFKAIDLHKGLLKISNQYDFRESKDFLFKYEITANGIPVLTDFFKPENILPHQDKQIILNYNLTSIKPDTEYFLNIFVLGTNNKQLIPENYVLAKEQFKLPFFKEKEIQDKSNSPLKVYNKEKELKIIGEDFSIIFDKNEGNLKSYTWKSVALLTQTMKPNFWRLPTDNDKGNNMPERCDIWKDIQTNRELTLFHFEEKEGQVHISTQSKLTKSNSSYQAVYIVKGNGEIIVKINFQKGSEQLPELPKFGMYLQMPGDFKQIKWLGRGPHESYADRKSSAFVGLYEGLIMDQYTPYVVPQESGNKTDVRWMAITNEKTGLVFSGKEPLSMGAYNYSIEDFDEKISHTYQIPWADFVEVHIDHKQMGVGGDNSWGNPVHDQYKLLDNHYQYEFTISPYTLSKTK